MTSTRSSATASAAECPFCRLSKTEFETSGRAGCAQCYFAFAPTAASGHTGKQFLFSGSNLAHLHEELREAIYKEEYECAALVRERIGGAA